MSSDHIPNEDRVGYADGELSAEATRRVEEHLRGCAECAADVEALRESGDLIAALPGLEPSAGFADAVLTATRARQPAGRLRRLAPVPLAAAALLVLALLVGGLWLGSGLAPVDRDRVLTAREEEEIARDLYLLRNLDALRDNDPEALVAIVDELDVLEDLDLETDGDGDGG